MQNDIGLHRVLHELAFTVGYTLSDELCIVQGRWIRTLYTVDVSLAYAYKLRWLSKGKVLLEVFQLKDQFRQFLFTQQVNSYFGAFLNDQTWCSKRECFVYIF